MRMYAPFKDMLPIYLLQTPTPPPFYPLDSLFILSMQVPDCSISFDPSIRVLANHLGLIECIPLVLSRSGPG